jgi:hypothetical protein
MKTYFKRLFKAIINQDHLNYSLVDKEWEDYKKTILKLINQYNLQ